MIEETPITLLNSFDNNEESDKNEGINENFDTSDIKQNLEVGILV